MRETLRSRDTLLKKDSKNSLTQRQSKDLNNQEFNFEINNIKNNILSGVVNSHMASFSPRVQNKEQMANTFISQKFSLQQDSSDKRVMRLNNSFM